MANQGKIQLLYVMVCPPENADEGKRLFESHGPWVMWPDTPYRHLMIPIDAR